jgi:uncharacterized membrane protein YgdD (TMEM256/DUF423 family)
LRIWIILAAVSGFLAVALGAFAAHGLQGRLGAKELDWIDTGLRYQMFHALALLAVALLSREGGSTALQVAGWGFTIGTLIFCGLLYTMALGGPRLLGAVVPLGGLAFLGGWLALAWYALRLR